METTDNNEKTVFVKKQKKSEFDDNKTVFVSKKTTDKPAAKKNLNQASVAQPATNKATRQTPKAGDKTQIAKRPAVTDKTELAKSPLQKTAVTNDKTQIVINKQRKVATANRDTASANTSKQSSSSKPVLRKKSPPVLKNRFVFEKLLGSGGMGMVYKAKDLLKVEAQDKSPYVAIKVLGEEFKSHPEAFIALQRESRKTQRIAHPNIVNVFDFDKDKNTVFMTMELLEGTPLDKLIAQYKATGIPKEDAWLILEGMCAALKHAHAEYIIHSDFKPGNIFVTNKGQAKVFDFGVARAVSKTEGHENDLQDKTVFDAGNLGALTPAYASKEMLEGKEPDVTDDIYALACIAYEMFTGQHPFNRVHANEAQKQQLKAIKPEMLSKRQWKVLSAGLAFDREERIQTVDEFWQQLTFKSASPVKMIMAISTILILIASIVYLIIFMPVESLVSEEEVRSQIEFKLRIEQLQARIDRLIASPQFDEIWSKELYVEISELSKVVTADNKWLQTKKAEIYNLYLEEINRHITNKTPVLAYPLVNNAKNYTLDSSRLDELLAELKMIEQQKKSLALAEQKQQQREAWLKKQQVKKQQQVIQAKKIKKEKFDQALQNVKGQVACKSGLNMRDFDIAINKLRQLNKPRYNKQEPTIVSSLASCIQKIGKTFPERAKDNKQFALRIFPKNKQLAAINISPKDPCSVSLAGLGARGKRTACYDTIKDSTRGPEMVVIPSMGGKPFAITKYEISNGDFTAYCLASKQCEQHIGEPNIPLTQVSYQQATDYAKWLSGVTGYHYRIPSYIEWLHTANAGNTGSDVLTNRNCQLNSRGIQKGKALINIEIGDQNKWGVVNMVGNAQEFVVNTQGEVIAVGGSFKTPMENCSVSFSQPHNSHADEITGFRLIRELAKN